MWFGAPNFTWRFGCNKIIRALGAVLFIIDQKRVQHYMSGDCFRQFKKNPVGFLIKNWNWEETNTVDEEKSTVSPGQRSVAQIARIEIRIASPSSLFCRSSTQWLFCFRIWEKFSRKKMFSQIPSWKTLKTRFFQVYSKFFSDGLKGWRGKMFD